MLLRHLGLLFRVSECQREFYNTKIDSHPIFLMHACVAILLRERAGISDGCLKNKDGWSVGEGRGWKSELSWNGVVMKVRRSNKRVDSAAALSYFYSTQV